MKIKIFFKSIILFSVIFINVSCSPRDINVTPLKERLLAGEILTVTKTGERLPTCLENDKDWNDFRVHENDYESHVLEDEMLSASAGYKNCYRVGERVSFENSKILNNGNLGWTEITGLVLMSSKTFEGFKNNKFSLKNKQFNVEESVVQRITGKMLPRHQGIVHLTTTKYVSGTSTLENAIIEKSKLKNSLESQLENGKIITFDQNGQVMESCNGEIWNDIRPHSSKYLSIKNGKLSTLISKGIKNCHKIGNIVSINIRDNPSAIGKVKIKGISLMSLDTLKSNKKLVEGEDAQNQFDADIRFIESKFTDEKNKLVNLLHFDLVRE